jgi:DNA-binding transcriptional ArsR family regulator
VATDFASVARLLANTSRAAMVDCLMEGGTVTAGELARVAGVSPPTASAHLAELEAGGLVRVTAQGRNKYYRIADRDVAAALEAFSLICPPRSVRSLRESRDAEGLARFRTCYDHLAGMIAVSLFSRMADLGWLNRASDGCTLTARGERELSSLGVNIEHARGLRRAYTRTCLDWTERRPHLAGAVGSALADVFLANRWASRRLPGRGLIITQAGCALLAERFGLELEGP